MPKFINFECASRITKLESWKSLFHTLAAFGCVVLSGCGLPNEANKSNKIQIAVERNGMEEAAVEHSADIVSPRDGDVVGRHFRVQLDVDNAEKAARLWLAVEVDGLIWPKEPPAVAGNDWSLYLAEGGNPPDGKFILSVWHASESAEEVIQEWLRSGQRTGDFPGLQKLPNSTRLDSVELRLTN